MGAATAAEYLFCARCESPPELQPTRQIEPYACESLARTSAIILCAPDLMALCSSGEKSKSWARSSQYRAFGLFSGQAHFFS